MASRKIKHLLFDLDYTLWDYPTNCRQSLDHLFDELALYQWDINKEQLFQAFMVANEEVWAAFDRRELDKESLRLVRFERVVRHLGKSSDTDLLALIPKLEEGFLQLCPQQTALMPGTIDMLNQVSEHYQIHILTNGFQESQMAKLHYSGLSTFVDELVTSECSGYRKPEKSYFDYALDKIQAAHHEVVMIGDKPGTDVLGAINAGIISIWYNPDGATSHWTPDYQISHLEQLVDTLAHIEL